MLDRDIPNKRLRLSRRMFDVCSWLCLGFNIIAWIMAFRLLQDADWPSLFWMMVVLRVGAMGLRDVKLRPRIGLFLDRVAWYAILLSPLYAADWPGVLIAVGLWTAWGFTAGLARYFYALAASDAERARAAELESL